MLLLHNPFKRRANEPYYILLASAGFSIRKTGGSHQWRHNSWILGRSPPWPLRMRFGGKEVTVPRDGLILIAPQVTYHECTERGRPWNDHVLSIQERRTPSVLRKLVGASGYCLFEDPSALIEPIMQQIVAHFQTPSPAGELLSQSLLYHVLGLLTHAKTNPGGMREIMPLVMRLDDDRSSLRFQVESYLRARNVRGVRTGEMARHLKMSVSAFTHRYCRETGETFLQTKERLCMEAAKTLLLGGDRSIKQVALEIGFPNVAYFSNSFLRATGMRPSDFLRHASPRRLGSSRPRDRKSRIA